MEEIDEEAKHLLGGDTYSVNNLNKTHGNSKKAPS